MSRRRKRGRKYTVMLSMVHQETFEGERRRAWLYGEFTKEELNEMKRRGWREWG